MKTRVLKIIQKNGKCLYVVQKKSLCFWCTCYELVSTGVHGYEGKTLRFDLLSDARRYEKSLHLRKEMKDGRKIAAKFEIPGECLE